MSKSKWRRFKPLATKQASQETQKTSLFESKSKPVALVGVIAVLIIGLGIAAYATNDLLRGHITITGHPNKTVRTDATTADEGKSALTKATTASPKAASDLIDKYGTAADSPAVAAAIRKAERHPDAKAASDAYKALEHGVWKPGASPIQAIQLGYVPPNMDPQQAAMLYSALPHLPKSPERMTPERIEKIAGGQTDPMDSLPEGLSQEDIRTANQQMVESHMRQRFGPIYVPPLHRDHNRVVSQKDNQMSLIEPEYSFDSGNGPPQSIREMTDASGNVVSQYGYDPYGRQIKIGGTGPDADFGYAGTYVHQRSGLLMMGARVYNPSMGRFMSRDPVNEPGFNMRTTSPEPSEPKPMVLAARPMAAIMPLAAAMPHGPFDVALMAHRTGSYPLLRSASAGIGLNPYTYVLNNPINYTDPTGLDPPAQGPDWGSFWVCIAQCARHTGNWPVYLQCFNDCYYGVGRCPPPPDGGGQ